MMWVLIFAGIALAGLITAISYAVWLWHKAQDLFSEVEMLGTRATELADLLSTVRLDALLGEDASPRPMRSPDYADVDV